MERETKARIERDTMGEMEIPANKLWGANTERARRNLPVASDKLLPRPILRALARIKIAVARVAGQKGWLSREICLAIEEAAGEIVNGQHWPHFPLDVFQTGSGTSSNMNVNEVVANLVAVSQGDEPGTYKLVNPNDHVNFGQSSNDTVPSAVHLGALEVLQNRLLPELDLLIESWKNKRNEYEHVVKTGRTHFQDALPVTFGHVFGSYVDILTRCKTNLEAALPLLAEIPLGGTAVGTGFQAPEELPRLAAAELSGMYNCTITAVEHPLTFMAGRPVVSDVMGRVATLATEMMRIANDVRMMASGPRLGIGELEIPSLQPGSSIMPGKVNPVVCESVIQTGLAVMGHNATVLAAATAGQFELNVTLPVTGWAFIGSISMLANACKILRTNLVDGLKVRLDAVEKDLNQSLALVTALISKIGYAEAAKIAYKAHKENLTPAQAAVAVGAIAADEVDKWLDPHKLIQPGRMK
jgi:fumarate hydratase class II